MEPWIETISGKKVNFLNPDPETIDITDIAFSLANQCRFNGHVSFFSVAEHCVSVSFRLPNHLKMAGLLHDASEAYLSDIPSPVKAYLPEYKTLEANLQRQIYKKFGIDYDTLNYSEIAAVDSQATWNEAYYLLPTQGKDWVPRIFLPQERYRPVCLPPDKAYQLFLGAFKQFEENTKIIV